MKKYIRKILLLSIILFALSMLFISVNAVTIQETTNTKDAYDTIKEGTIIIGTTKFSPDTVITAKKAAIAGANDMKVFVAKGGNINSYKEPEIYYYVMENAWFNIKEDGAVVPISNISSLELYFVDNEPKKGIDNVTKEEIKIEEPKEVATHTVTFMNDSKVFEIQEVKEGEKATVPTKTPTKSGYVFKGWLNIDFTKTVTGDIVAIANWEQVTYTVVFDSNGGSNIASQSVASGEKASKPEDPTKTNYVFEGWYLGNTIYDFGKQVNANITLKAKWSLEKYTVTFMKDTSVYSEVVVERGQKVSRPTTDPTKEGYTFIDWYRDGASFNFNTQILENTIITAEFKAKVFNITIGIIKNGTVTVPNTSVICGDNVVITATPNTGYLLNSLTVKDSSNNNIAVSTDNIFKMPESNVTISAEFIRDSVSVDNRNDQAIDTEVNKIMTQIANGENGDLIEVVYNKSNNTLTLVLNDENDETVNVVNVINSELDLITEVTENIKTITYNEEVIDVSNLTVAKAKIAKVLLQVAGVAIPGDDASIITAAKALTFANLKDKTIIIKADYEADKQIDYKLVIEAKNPTTVRDTKNDNTISGLTSTIANDNVFTEMTYNKASNSATLMVDEEKKKQLVVDHADNFVNTILEIANEANSFYYKVGDYTSTTINLTNKNAASAKLQVSKILLKMVPSKTDPTKITLEDIIGKSAQVTIQYNYGVNLTYNISIGMISYKESNNDIKISTIASEFVDSEHNALDISYNNTTNNVTLSMAPANNSIKVIDYYTTLWNVVKTVATDANSISYKVGTINGSETTATTALKKIVKALLAETGNPTTEEAAELLEFGEIVTNALDIQIDVDYGNDIVLNYKINFVNT